MTKSPRSRTDRPRKSPTPRLVEYKLERTKATPRPVEYKLAQREEATPRLVDYRLERTKAPSAPPYSAPPQPKEYKIVVRTATPRLEVYKVAASTKKEGPRQARRRGATAKR